MSEPRKNVVNVTIAGEDYTLRAGATPEYTQACAAHVDAAIREIMQQGTLVPSHKAAILAALAISDQLFQAQRESADLRAEIARLADRLTADVRMRLTAEDLAAHP